jgi:hypothetical protein
MIGPTYQMRMSRQIQEGDPVHQIVQQLALREPPGYEHPRRLRGDVLQPGGPRIMPVSQKVSHGADISREAAFDKEAAIEAAALAQLYGLMGWKDRRVEGADIGLRIGVRN